MREPSPVEMEKTVREISDKVRRMRAAKPTASWTAPSRYWSDYVSLLEYMLDPDVPLACFKRLRHHTYHLTGAMPAHYIQGWHASLIDLRWVIQAYRQLSARLPQRYHISEPDELGGFGVRVSEALVNADIVRFMSAIAVLHESGALARLEASPQPMILEIGGGWGGLAHHLTSLLGKSKYFIVDLPEVLLFSTCYLTLMQPERRLYLYDEESYSEVRNKGFEGYEYVCLPNWTFPDFTEPVFDLVVNQCSFQEMTTAQVRLYLEGICRICRGNLYSFNQDFQEYNAELGGLFREIEGRFDAREYFPIPGEGGAQPGVAEWLAQVIFREARRVFDAFRTRLQRRSFATGNPSRHLVCAPRRLG